LKGQNHPQSSGAAESAFSIIAQRPVDKRVRKGKLHDRLNPIRLEPWSSIDFRAADAHEFNGSKWPIWGLRLLSDSLNAEQLCGQHSCHQTSKDQSE
jgi:hypothetical protein